MLIELIVGTVGAAWVILAFVDEYAARYRLGRRIGFACIAVIGVVAVVDTPAFASATTAYVQREAKSMTDWLVHSIDNVVRVPSVTTPPPKSQP